MSRQTQFQVVIQRRRPLYLEGYNTMDALAGLAFGVTVVTAIQQMGQKDPKSVSLVTAMKLNSSRIAKHGSWPLENDYENLEQKQQLSPQLLLSKSQSKDMIVAFPKVVSQSHVGLAVAGMRSYLPLASIGMSWAELSPQLLLSKSQSKGSLKRLDQLDQRRECHGLSQLLLDLS